MNSLITVPQLSAILGAPAALAEKFAPHLSATAELYEIDTPLRLSAFVAQVGHESGRLRYVREIWNPVQCPWQEKYEGRADLGNTHPGDGRRFMGRGLIQITGRANYRSCGFALGLDLETNPELLESPEWAARSAGWYWRERKLNLFADQRDMHAITKIINGGYNGIKDRLDLYAAAKKEFGI